MNQVNLILIRGSLIKTLPWVKRIGFSTKILKEVVMLLRCLGVLVVRRNTRVGVFPTWTVALYVVIRTIKCEISLTSRPKVKRSTKLLVIVRIPML